MADPAPRENFVIPTPEHVATTEAGSHTLASVGAGLELSQDAYGLAGGEAKSQSRIVLSRFLHQRLAILGLCIFATLGIA
jgi:hypothetical protein